MTARAARNNNPGNLDAHDSWLGLQPRDKMTPEQTAETRFAVFSAPKWGFRALGIIVLNYWRVHHLQTIGLIIKRWAPNSENDTGSYIAAVCRGMNVKPDDVLDLTNPMILASLAKCISIHECGTWLFMDVDLMAGIHMAYSQHDAMV